MGPVIAKPIISKSEQNLLQVQAAKKTKSKTKRDATRRQSPPPHANTPWVTITTRDQERRRAWRFARRARRRVTTNRFVYLSLDFALISLISFLGYTDCFGVLISLILFRHCFLVVLILPWAPLISPVFVLRVSPLGFMFTGFNTFWDCIILTLYNYPACLIIIQIGALSHCVLGIGSMRNASHFNWQHVKVSENYN